MKITFSVWTLDRKLCNKIRIIHSPHIVIKNVNRKLFIATWKMIALHVRLYETSNYKLLNHIHFVAPRFVQWINLLLGLLDLMTNCIDVSFELFLSIRYSEIVFMSLMLCRGHFIDLFVIFTFLMATNTTEYYQTSHS